MSSLLLALATAATAFANPYFDKTLVPKDAPTQAAPLPNRPLALEREKTSEAQVLRVQIDWDPSTGQYQFGALTREMSGTPALARRALRPDSLGSFKATLSNPETHAVLASDSIGTGEEFKRLTRAITFRFPFVSEKVLFEMSAENPTTGIIEKVFERVLDPANETREPRALDARALQARVLKEATQEPKLLINVYADGYIAGRDAKFWTDAAKVVRALESIEFPRYANLEIRAVFYPSKTKLGSAEKLGLPVPERDSFLGLYYPYWRDFGRWYNVVYPTREERFRDGLAAVPYDYPIVLIDNGEYWGVGNYKELTAIPSDDDHFTYLLLHEFGHFFGLNEEYEGGGPTELQFAPEVVEPWSQNITFLRDPHFASLKWNAFVDPNTPLPTPRQYWGRPGHPYGAYAGGYADSEPRHTSHKPGLSCVMERYNGFCPVCTRAIKAVIDHDL